MLRNKKWTWEFFLEERKKVLATWHTGNDPLLDFNESIKYLKSLPRHKNFGLKLIDAKNQKRTLIEPRAGVPVLEKHIELLQYLENLVLILPRQQLIVIQD